MLARLRRVPWRFPLLASLGLLVLGGYLCFNPLAPWAMAVLGSGLLLLMVSVGLVLRDARRDSEQHELLLQAMQELCACVELDELLERLVQSALRLVPAADKCVVHLVDESGQRLYARITSHVAQEPSLGMPVDKGIAGLALRERRTIVVQDVRQAEGFLPLDSQEELRSLMVAPLHMEGDPLGTISLNSAIPKAFSEADQVFLSTLAVQASAAIYQSALYHRARQQTHYVEAILNHLNDGLVVLDAEGRVLRHNAALSQVLGIHAEAIDGQIVHPKSDREALRRLAQILGNELGYRQHYERQVELHEPFHMILQVSVSTVPDGAGSPERIAIIHDQTAETERERSRSALLAAVVQEMRLPLEALRGYVTLLHSDEALDREAVQSWLLQMRAHSERLLRLERDLLDLCLAESDALQIQREAVGVLAFCEEVLQEVTSLAAAQGVTIELHCPHNLPPLPLDAERIRHVLLNLLEYALQRAFEGGYIRLHVEETVAEATFTIHDDGRLVSQQVIQSALQGSYRGNNACGRDGETGLRLYLSRRLVEAHGGYLWLAENEAKNVRLQFVIPLEGG